MTQTFSNNQPNVNNSSVALAAQPSEIGAREMSSLEIAEITGKRHDAILRDIRNLLEQGVAAHNFVESCYTDKSNRKSPCFNLTKKGCLILASGYNAVLREKIIDRWEALETGQATPMYQASTTQQPTYSLEDKFKAIDLSCKILRVSKASKARMINSVIAPMGLPVFDYVESEGACLSAKDLLEKHKVEYNGKVLKSAIFNTIMEEHGYIERVERSTRDGFERFPVLTEKGLKWGKNDEPTQGHHGKVQPRYYVNKFPRLLQELGLLQKGE